MVIYIAFFVFLFTDAVLYNMFLPALSNAAAASGGGGGFIKSVPMDDMRFIYFSAAIVQALGNGLVAGILSDARIATGTRHSFIMVLAAWVTFKFVL
jgi:flagellar protein FlaJ